MAVALEQLKLYTRVALMILAVLLILTVLFFNRNHDTDVWFFHPFHEVNVVWVMVATSVGSVVSFWLLTQVIAVRRDFRRLRRNSELPERQPPSPAPEETKE
jgi:hypothetical protein